MKKVTIKRVKKSGNMWCKTTKLPGDGKHHQLFKQEWSISKPNLNE